MEAQKEQWIEEFLKQIPLGQNDSWEQVLRSVFLPLFGIEEKVAFSGWVRALIEEIKGTGFSIEEIYDYVQRKIHKEILEKM